VEFDVKKTIALVAHDNKKNDLMEWADLNKGTLPRHSLYATGGTGKRIMAKTGLNITLLKALYFIWCARTRAGARTYRLVGQRRNL